MGRNGVFWKKDHTGGEALKNKELGASVIAQVAKNNGMSEEEMRNDMQEEILAAYGNKETRNQWEKIFGKGVIPTPEAFIEKLGQMSWLS